jgi:multicomponent Na+:H+ antiporter subunit A
VLRLSQADDVGHEDTHTRDVWLAAGRTQEPRRRSVLFEVVTRAIFHTMIVYAVFLLFAGHNAPGGGFAAGLVVGIALTVRYLAGGRYELGEAAPVHPGLLLGTGLFLSAGVGLAALVAGQEVLESFIVHLDVPVLGHVKLVTSLFFDVGVMLVVVGLVLDILRTLGAELDRQGGLERRGA